MVPRTLALAALLLTAGCNEIRYQTAKLRAKASRVEAPKLAALPDHRTTYSCPSADPFDVYFPRAASAPCCRWAETTSLCARSRPWPDGASPTGSSSSI
ncbi:MAG: hypothetical protein M0D55_03745 [Elusimicrobiota bacterium]|nr:MAG: hypothetical protein M0D55_03745 [Elusimicrobiota bacterium]